MDENWREASGERIAYYSQLATCNYNFRVTVGGSDGQRTKARNPSLFRVVHRLWEIRWVQVLASALLISAVGASIARISAKAATRLERMELQQSLNRSGRRIAREPR